MEIASISPGSNIKIIKIFEEDEDPPTWLSYYLCGKEVADFDEIDFTKIDEILVYFVSGGRNPDWDWNTEAHHMSMSLSRFDKIDDWFATFEQSGCEFFSINAQIYQSMKDLLNNGISVKTSSFEERKNRGLCIRCGDQGKWIRSALICTQGHGLICGC